MALDRDMEPLTLACSCGEPLSLMRIGKGWALGHLDALDAQGITAATLEELFEEFARSPRLEHSPTGQ